MQAIIAKVGSEAFGDIQGRLRGVVTG